VKKSSTLMVPSDAPEKKGEKGKTDLDHGKGETTSIGRKEGERGSAPSAA